MRLVLDTCVLVAGLRSRDGASFQLLRAMGDGWFTPLLSVPLLLEYEAVLKRPVQLEACGLTADDIDTVLDVLAAKCEAIRLYYLWRPFLNDPADEMVLELAAQSNADAIVTHNARDFAGAERFGVAITSPGEALAAMTRRRS